MTGPLSSTSFPAAASAARIANKSQFTKTAITETMKQSLSLSLPQIPFPALIAFMGRLNGFFLGHALARTIKSPRLAGILSRLCIIAGAIQVFSFAAKIVTRT